jgi:DNA-binding IclR family transcriptional regulator
MRVWELGQLAGRRLRDRARPFLQDLFDLTHENIHIAVREGTQTLYIDKIYGSKKMPRISRVGGRLPMHATAVGRVLLAAQPDWFVDAYLERELQAPTQMTVTDPKILREVITQVRAENFALTVEQMRVGQLSIAMPVVVEGTSIAAVGMVLDKERLSDTKRLKPLLSGTVERISGVMAGGNGY